MPHRQQERFRKAAKACSTEHRKKGTSYRACMKRRLKK